MNPIQETSISCPYCGEVITILIDASADVQHYIEDCQVCCRPMDIRVSVSGDGNCRLEVRNENE